MSDSQEADLTDNTDALSEYRSKKCKFKIPSSLKEKLQNIPEALDYIKLLEKELKRQHKKLKKLKAKYKKLPKQRNVGIQTDLDSILSYSSEASTEKPKTLLEEIKEAAELATQNTGFVYDENMGLYYDSNTGYYYNSEYGLYYDSATGTYLSYNSETSTYDFHSQVPVYTAKNHHKKKSQSQRKKNSSRDVKVNKFEQSDDVEHLTSCFHYLNINKLRTFASDITRHYPPCMRIIVEQSNAPKIKTGSLHILTYEGGTLGREGSHAILIPDINISKCHLKFTFETNTNQYFVTDLGSRNGTVLNGKRMAVSKQESEASHVAHGSRLQIGSVTLLCHIHEGSTTCGHCEPGLLQTSEVSVKPVSTISKSDTHKLELKKLRKKFGVTGFEQAGAKLASGYTDRAQHRRETKGSSNAHEKTEVASLEESISSENKGFKMLAKMGWKEGQSLGKESQGILEPIPLVSNPGTSGMGNADVVSDKVVDSNKQMIWKKTQERFKLLHNNVFSDCD